MFRNKAEVAIILGAGFSKNAGIPLQNEFSNMILSSCFNDSIDIVITNAIKVFLKKVFNWEEGNELPTLEDIFTMIDLSTGTGHNLGRAYTPKKLRALRRMLIYRCFQILDYRFEHSNEIDQLLKFYLPDDREILTHFVVLNWDIVLERHLESIHNNPLIDYCIQAKPWGSDYGSNPSVSIAKVHGSSNWVYCDNCHSVFYDRDRKLSLKIKAGLIKSDFRLFDESFSDKAFDDAIQLLPTERECHCCKCAVGPHIATFSYKKSFRTHAFSSSWMAAEQILDQADNWIFIGYSLPDADYEFKHLLKSSQLKLSSTGKYTKHINVVLYHDDKAQFRYETLFGKGKINIFQDGLTEYINEIQKHRTDA
jgi:NAD-dependent SIR2 family protein deacetylase